MIHIKKKLFKSRPAESGHPIRPDGHLDISAKQKWICFNAVINY